MRTLSWFRSGAQRQKKPTDFFSKTDVIYTQQDVSRDMSKDSCTNHVMKIIVPCSTAGEEDSNIADIIINIEETKVLLGCLRGIGGSVVGFSPIMRKAQVRFPATGCSAGPKPGKMGGLCQERHLA
ncbi:hypothetical protein QTP70_011815 [Hemibagrus guttatus]|uniref:Uncharacterized protein n=1 Tax=Hemibagrus guttatus TaxID=175788 RepID=A0AAE0UZA7_9TELE|nr:hypothetical protein QTP70_011815 [Hemibagrus guttatus]KAK3557938.1 hypothetical protein QTP86_003861 [Hemibagrus guttatus]